MVQCYSFINNPDVWGAQKSTSCCLALHYVRATQSLSKWFVWGYKQSSDKGLACSDERSPQVHEDGACVRRPVIFMRALCGEGVRLLAACQLAQSPWQGGGVRVPARLPPPVWSLEESPGSCREGLLGGQGLQCVNVCVVYGVCVIREIKGAVTAREEGKPGGAGSKLVRGTFRFLPEERGCAAETVGLRWP